MTQWESSRLEQLQERIRVLEQQVKSLEGLPEQVRKLTRQLTQARFDLAKSMRKLEAATAENQSLRATLDILDNGVKELLLATVGNVKFGQKGIVQNLEILTQEVASIKEKQRTTDATVNSLDGTRRWLRAKAAMWLGGAGTAIGSAIWWGITHLEQINKWINPQK
ncbi:AAA family ATPase [Hymenobacter metallicola]|uniref:Uncharacterized protein n=1 Tax=Hymenobacter metallicola TaxID=2563114 RepID=A0A4Z0QKK6_9BACT|nr:hypothetical protein [Hymenobacter metallicola]TGE29789.1 hypothetical protein E5K02_10120 [Hymenobacter metallicola]